MNSVQNSVQKYTHYHPKYLRYFEQRISRMLINQPSASNLAKVEFASSTLVFRSNFLNIIFCIPPNPDILNLLSYGLESKKVDKIELKLCV